MSVKRRFTSDCISPASGPIKIAIGIGYVIRGREEVRVATIGGIRLVIIESCVVCRVIRSRNGPLIGRDGIGRNARNQVCEINLLAYAHRIIGRVDQCAVAGDVIGDEVDHRLLALTRAAPAIRIRTARVNRDRDESVGRHGYLERHHSGVSAGRVRSGRAAELPIFTGEGVRWSDGEGQRVGHRRVDA